MKILFIGGINHGKVADTRSGEVPMRRVLIPSHPDDSSLLFTGEGAIVQSYVPMDYNSYVLRVVVDGERRAYVYVAEGIKDAHIAIYLEEPYLKEKFTKVSESFQRSDFSISPEVG